MAHFIRLTEAQPTTRIHYINTQNIAEFFGGIAGSYIILMSQNIDVSEAYLVEESPDQILALIAEAQGAK